MAGQIKSENKGVYLNLKFSNQEQEELRRTWTDNQKLNQDLIHTARRVRDLPGFNAAGIFDISFGSMNGLIGIILTPTFILVTMAKPEEIPDYAIGICCAFLDSKLNQYDGEIALVMKFEYHNLKAQF